MMENECSLWVFVAFGHSHLVQHKSCVWCYWLSGLETCRTGGSSMNRRTTTMCPAQFHTAERMKKKNCYKKY